MADIRQTTPTAQGHSTRGAGGHRAKLLITTLATQLDLIKNRDDEQARTKTEAQWRQRSLKRLQEEQLKKQSKLGTTTAARDKAVEQGRAIQCAGTRANSGSEPRRPIMQPPDDSDEDDQPVMRLKDKRGRGESAHTGPPFGSPSKPTPAAVGDGATANTLRSPMTRKQSVLAMAPPSDSEGDTPPWKLDSRAQQHASMRSGPVRRSPRREALEVQEMPYSQNTSWLATRDRGKYSFGANNPSLMALYETIMGKVMAHCIPLSVQATMKSHIKRWRNYCDGLNTTPVRDDVAANLGIDRKGYEDELMLLGYAAIDALQDM